MGLNLEYIEFIEKHTTAYKNNSKMLELGNQMLQKGISGKEYFQSKFSHISVDWNGLNGSLKKDLRYPEQFVDWKFEFDIITNMGTTEHVEPPSKQYDCFSILHNCLKEGGVQIHITPGIESLNLNSWTDHCLVYYSFDFFKMLAVENHYEILEIKLINNLIAVAFKKKKNVPFMSNKKMFLDSLFLNYNNNRPIDGPNDVEEK